MKLHAQIGAGRQTGDKGTLDKERVIVGLQLLQAHRHFELPNARLDRRIVGVVQVGVANRGRTGAAKFGHEQEIEIPENRAL